MHKKQFDRQEAKEMRQKGKTYQKIADRFDVSRQAVCEALRDERKKNNYIQKDKYRCLEKRLRKLFRRKDEIEKEITELLTVGFDKTKKEC